MKFKVQNREKSTMWVSVDEKPSRLVSAGTSAVVEAEKVIVVAGNPIDPWRIVAEIELIK